MEAMDQLLLACHARQLNLFVESFLKMVQKLLESTEPDLQILATQSVSSSSPFRSAHTTGRRSFSVREIRKHRGGHSFVPQAV